MEEKKKARTIAEITKDYSDLCAKAGDLGFKLFSFKNDLDQVQALMRDLNFEYVTAKNLADAVAAAAKPVEATITPAEQKEEG
jgi:hypothetical protein